MFTNFPIGAANGLCHHSCIGLRNPQLHDIGCSAVLKGGLGLKHESDYRTKEGCYELLACFVPKCLLYCRICFLETSIRQKNSRKPSEEFPGTTRMTNDTFGRCSVCFLKIVLSKSSSDLMPHKFTVLSMPFISNHEKNQALLKKKVLELFKPKNEHPGCSSVLHTNCNF